LVKTNPKRQNELRLEVAAPGRDGVIAIDQTVKRKTDGEEKNKKEVIRREKVVCHKTLVRLKKEGNIKLRRGAW